MVPIQLAILFPLCSFLVMAAPQNTLPTDVQDQPPPSHLDKSWETGITVVFVVLVSAVIAISLWATIRRPRNARLVRANGQFSEERRASLDQNWVKCPSTVQVNEEDNVKAPSAVYILPYDERSKLQSWSPTFAPSISHTGSLA